MPETEAREPGLWRLFRESWRPMFSLQILFLLIGLALAGPLAGFAIHRAVGLSGSAALSDTEIALILLKPNGLLLALALGALVLTFQFLGYSAQLLAAHAIFHGSPVAVFAIILRITTSLPSLIRLALRFLLRQALVALPFVAGIAVVYLAQLRGADINYYLKEKPPEFLWAIGLAGLLAVMMAIFQIRSAVSWIHALPLILIRRESPAAARRISAGAAHGSRHRIFLVLLLWGALTPLLISLLNLPWPALALKVAALTHDRLGLLALALGVALCLSVAVSLVVGFLALSLLALYHIRLFRRAGLDLQDSAPLRGRHSPFGIKSLIAAGLAALAAAGFVSFRWLDSFGKPDHAVVIAHRGASARAPENTLAAINAAINARADWVEIDVRETAEGEIIVLHDADFMRVGKRRLAARDATLAELAELDIGSWFDPRFADQRPPTLRQVLELCKGGAGLLIELKYDGREQQFEQRVIDLVEEAGMADQVMVMSLNYDGTRRIRELRPDWKVGLLSTVAVGNVTKLDVDFLGLNSRRANLPLIRRAHRAGVEIYVWTVNDPNQMSALLSRGVDGLITDEPLTARNVLSERAALNPAERLLIDLAVRFGKLPPQPGQ